MGIFDFAKRKRQAGGYVGSSEKTRTGNAGTYCSQIPESEKRYYQKDEYYTDYVPTLAVGLDGTYGKRKVITFDERKKISYPSRSGLYVPEILLIGYCSYGTYPHPKTGYPGFWWFEYGIRNVGEALHSLEDREYIELGSAKDQFPKMTIPQLKKLASNIGVNVSGKKQDILDQIVFTASTEEIEKFVTERKYKLTEKGKSELQENGYVLYMHKHPGKTIDIDMFGPIFNVWEVNRRIGKTGRTDWENIVHEIEDERNRYLQRNSVGCK